MKIWVDANPKIACFVTEVGYSECRPFATPKTNNEAEYEAVLFALETIKNMYYFEIYSDSKLVVNQLNRQWHIKKDNLRELAQKIWKHIAERNDRRGCKVTFTWIPREENKAGKMLP